LEYPIHAQDIGVSDPHILADKATGKYYMTSSGFTLPGHGFGRVMGTIFCLVSEDLIHWSEPIKIFDCNGTDFWGKMGYPAVEMHLIHGKYYLSSTAGSPGETRKSFIVAADNPLGPYQPLTNERYSPIGWQTIDSTLYVDKNEHPWLVFSHEWLQVSDGQFVAMPLSDDLTHTIGGPKILFRASEAKWGDDQVWSRTDGGGVTDGCWFHRLEDGTLIMLWTTRSRTGYALGYAKSTSGEIYGPWVQMERPLYAHDGGHCNLFRRLDNNQLMMSMHCADRGPKMFALFEMEDKNGELNIINEAIGNWTHILGGDALPYKKNVRCIDEPAFTTVMPSGYEGLKLIEAEEVDTTMPKKSAKKAAKAQEKAGKE